LWIDGLTIDGLTIGARHGAGTAVENHQFVNRQFVNRQSTIGNPLIRNLQSSLVNFTDPLPVLKSPDERA